jgi:hypothetical protein
MYLCMNCYLYTVVSISQPPISILPQLNPSSSDSVDRCASCLGSYITKHDTYAVLLLSICNGMVFFREEASTQWYPPLDWQSGTDIIWSFLRVLAAEKYFRWMY